jgi:hypothetical protein
VTLHRGDLVAGCAICGGGIRVVDAAWGALGWLFKHCDPHYGPSCSGYVSTTGARTPDEIADRLTGGIAALHGIDWPPKEGTDAA